MGTQPRSFVQAVEVWVPDGNLLQRKSWAYGTLSSFAEASAELTLQKGQGLPGVAYRSMRPEVWHELGPRFVRAPSARLSGLDAAVALPWFRGNTVDAVVVFLCGSRTETGGCIEAWEPGEQELLVHMDGYYGSLTAFEDVSRVMRFPLGQGLPGVVWEQGLPHIVEDLRTSTSFMRAAAARECGVQSGLGIPLFCGGRVQHVVTFLSAESTPLARAFEVWIPDHEGRLSLKQSFYTPELSELQAQSRGANLWPGEAIAGGVLEAGLPWVVDFASQVRTLSRASEFGSRPESRASTAAAPGLSFAIGLPVHDGTRLRAVVVMFG
jgi:hypothetical protein